MTDHIERLKNIPREQEKVPCKICGTPTRMTNTELCDACWSFISAAEFMISMRGMDNFVKALKIIMGDHMNMLIEKLTNEEKL